MPFPLLPLLVGGGLTAGNQFFENNPAKSNSFIDTIFDVNRGEQRKAAQVQQEFETRQAATAQLDLADPASFLRAGQLTGDNSFITQALNLQERQRATKFDFDKATADLFFRRQDRAEDLTRADTTALVSQYQRLLAPFAEQQQNFAGLRNSLENGSAQDALTATIGIMKTLDPTSVVRQEEGRAVVQAEGAMASFANTLNKIIGKGWNVTTRREWFEAVRRVYAPAQQRASRQIGQLGDEAQRRGVNPNALTGLGIDRNFPGVNTPFKSTGKGVKKTAEEIKEEFGLTVIGET